MTDDKIQVRNEFLEFRVLAHLVVSAHDKRRKHHVYGIYRSLLGKDLEGNTLKITPVSKAAKRLAEKGWIMRCDGEPHADFPNGRRTCYTVTESGKAAFREYVPIMRQFGEQLLKDINDGLIALGDIPDDK